MPAAGTASATEIYLNRGRKAVGVVIRQASLAAINTRVDHAGMGMY